VAFAAAIALLGYVEYLGYRATESLVETNRWVIHTHDVIDRLESFTANMLEAETARRGFALSGNPTEQQAFGPAAAGARKALVELRPLVADNEHTSADVAVLAQATEQRLALLAEAIEARKAGFEPERETGFTTRGNEMRSEMRARVQRMIDTERQLLVERERATRESVESSRRTERVGTAASLGAVLLVIVRLQREVRRRRRSERIAVDNQQRLAATLNGMAEGFISVDEAGRVLRMNPLAEKLTGWKIDDGRGRDHGDVFRLVHDVTAKDIATPLAAVLEGKEATSLIDAALLEAKNGKKRRVSGSAAPVRDAEGRVAGAVLLFQDISKTLDDARALRRAHSFLDSVVENIPNMIFVKEAAELTFVRFNKAGETLLGMKRDTFIGKNDFAFFPEDQARAFVEKDRETLRGRTIVDIPEEPLTTADGVRWLHTKKVPIVDEDGEPEYLLGISEDITDRRRADADLRAAKDVAEVAHRELESFSYSVAHDLRSPLRSIDGFSQALLDDYGPQLDAQGRNYLERVRNAARRMAELIDDLLALARVSGSELTLTMVDVAALAQVVGDAARKERNPTARLVVREPMIARADARLVRILLENLLSNAFKFSGKKPDASVEVGIAPAHVGQGLTAPSDAARAHANGRPVFFVRDDGAGFDAAAAKKLFVAFQRYHRPNEYEGTGIGLATAQRIVSRHGGRIWAESTPGAGATFYFFLEPGDAS